MRGGRDQGSRDRRAELSNCLGRAIRADRSPEAGAGLAALGSQRGRAEPAKRRMGKMRLEKQPEARSRRALWDMVRALEFSLHL